MNLRTHKWLSRTLLSSVLACLLVLAHHVEHEAPAADRSLARSRVQPAPKLADASTGTSSTAVLRR